MAELFLLGGLISLSYLYNVRYKELQARTFLAYSKKLMVYRFCRFVKRQKRISGWENTF